MKKLTTPLLGLLLLAVACNKQEAPPTTESQPDAPQALAEPPRRCAAQEVLEQQLATDPVRKANLEALERVTRLYMQGQGGLMRTAGKLYIPVVINIVLPDATIVSDAQIKSQIDVLNADYQKANTELSNSNVYLAGYSWSSVANCELEFVVVKVNTRSGAGTFGTNDAVKKSATGIAPTNPTKALNLWVCDLSSGLLGYAQFPGGSAATDGVVIDYQAFGTTASYQMYAAYHKGRSATHEIGHWLNLRHIWGDRRCGDDLVSDTPPHDDANYGCPSNNTRSKCSGRPLEMWMNYMDYTDDACMYMFSGGQKARMDAAIDASRAAYTSTTVPSQLK